MRNQTTRTMNQLHIACLKGYTNTVQMLLMEPNFDVNAGSDKGWSALAYAVLAKNTTIVSMLLDHPNIDISKVYRDDTGSPLVFSLSPETDILKVLLTKYQTCFVKSGLLNGEILLKLFHIACSKDFIDVAKTLIDYGQFNLNAFDSNAFFKLTALHKACLHGRVNIVKLLLSHEAIQFPVPANLKGTVTGEMWIVLVAARNGRSEVVEYLLNCNRLSVVYSRTEEIPALLLAAKQATSGKYARVAYLLLNKIKYNLLKEPNKYAHQLKDLMRCAVHHNVKSVARHVNGICMEALSLTAHAQHVNAAQFSHIVYENYIAVCYNDESIPESGWLPVGRLSKLLSTITRFALGSRISLQQAMKIFFSAVKLGLVQHVEIILHEAPRVIDSVISPLSDQNISLLELSMQHEEISDRLFEMLNQIKTSDKEISHKIKSVKAKAEKFKKWYKLLAKITSVLKQHSVIVDTEENRKQEFEWTIQTMGYWENEEEYQLVCDTILNLMEKVAQQFYESIFAFRPIRVGSSSEGTRPFFPDEFDYLLVFEKLGAFFQFISEDDVPNVVFRLRYNGVYPVQTNIQEILHDGFCDGVYLKDKFAQLLQACLKKLFKPNFNGYLIIEENFYTSERKRVHNLRLIWRGNVFKDMEINVDLVPVFKIPDYCPPVAKDIGPFANGPYYLITKVVQFLDDGPHSLPVAFSTQENRIILSLPAEMRKGFRLAKALRRSMLFSNEMVVKLERYVDNIGDYLTTYMLKTSVFLLAHSYGLLSNTPNQLKVESPLVWTQRIYQKLLEMLYSGEIPSFFEMHLGLLKSEGNCTFLCEDSIYIDESKMRDCCIRRRNLIAITEYLLRLIRSYKYGDATRSVIALLKCI